MEGKRSNNNRLQHLYEERDKILAGTRTNPSGTIRGVRKLQRIEQQIYDMEHGVNRVLVLKNIKKNREAE